MTYEEPYIVFLKPFDSVKMIIQYIGKVNLNSK